LDQLPLWLQDQNCFPGRTQGTKGNAILPALVAHVKGKSLTNMPQGQRLAGVFARSASKGGGKNIAARTNIRQYLDGTRVEIKAH
jgi:hypothetical protein